MPGENHSRLKRCPSLVVLPVVLLAAVLLMGAGCTAPVQDAPTAVEPTPASVAEAPAAPAPAAASPVRDARPSPRPAPPMSDPLPPLRAAERDAVRAPRTAPTPTPVELPTGAAVKIDTSCTRDADCSIKNVGNCCGYYPACVNVDSPTDPAAVQAQCAREGRMSVCGFPSISACQCVAGECQGDSAAVER